MRRTAFIEFGVVVSVVVSGEASFAQTQPPAPLVVANDIRAPLAGRMYTPAIANPPCPAGSPAHTPPCDFYGTDLGITFQHRGHLRVLFGDTISSELGNRIGSTNPASDDASSYICLEASSDCQSFELIPTGAAVDNYVNGDPFGGLNQYLTAIPWQRGGPPIHFEVDSTSKTRPFSVMPGGGAPIAMGSGNTPVAAFSNSPSATPPPGVTATQFAMFLRGDYASCSNDAQCAPFTCDLNLATRNFGDITVACSRDQCTVPPGSGLCVDPLSSVYGNGSWEGRRLSVVRRVQVGNSLVTGGVESKYQFATVQWLTNRFTNMSVRTVEDFDPARTDFTRNDYRPSDGTGANQRVFLWGRPVFVGDRGQTHPAKLYLAYTNVPTYGSTGPNGFSPMYFTGVVGGRATFSSNPTTAVPLQLGPNGSTDEPWDVVNQFSVSYVVPLKKWVMLYGGDAFPDHSQNPARHPLLPTAYNLDSDTTESYHPWGSVLVRTATDPWGPWSDPVPLYPKDTTEALLSYAQDGLLHNPNCTDPNHCVHHESDNGFAPWGFMYGVNIVDNWTTSTTANGKIAATLYWNVSTWDPYQVVLMRSTIQ
jgi:hypothetical protein